MKRIIILLIATSALLSGCMSYPLAQRQIDTVVYDYRPFENQGFLITPTMYTGQYKSVGEIEVRVFPADVIGKSKQVYDGAANSYYTTSIIEKEKIESNELLQIIVNKAKDLGADALVNFKGVKVYNSYYNGSVLIRTFSYYELSGFAIKRQ